MRSVLAAATATLLLASTWAKAAPPDAVEGFVESHERHVDVAPGSPFDFSRDELRRAIQAEFAEPVDRRRERAPDPRSGWRDRVLDAAKPRRRPPPPEPGPSHPDRTPNERLREMAFQIDRMAHELEMREMFHQADGLRQAAARLRNDARPRSAFADPGPTPAFSAPRPVSMDPPHGMPDAYRPYLQPPVRVPADPMPAGPMTAGPVPTGPGPSHPRPTPPGRLLFPGNNRPGERPGPAEPPSNRAVDRPERGFGPLTEPSRPPKPAPAKQDRPGRAG